MAHRARTHVEIKREQALRHRVEAEAALQLENARRSNLSDAYFQGRGNAVLQGEVPLDTHYTRVMEHSVAQGYQHERQIPEAAPRNLPLAVGYAAHAEFPTFRALNMGQARLSCVVGGKSILRVGDSFESARRASSLNI